MSDQCPRCHNFRCVCDESANDGADDNTQDLTPYDLAERLIAGLPVTDAGKIEIACELLALRDLIRKADDGPELAIKLVTRVG